MGSEAPRQTLFSLSLFSLRECERMGYGAPRWTLLILSILTDRMRGNGKRISSRAPRQTVHILSLFSPREWRENGLWSSEADASHSLSILNERMPENGKRMRSGAPRWTLLIFSLFSTRKCEKMVREWCWELRGGRFSFRLSSHQENARKWREDGLWSSQVDGSPSLSILTERM